MGYIRKEFKEKLDEMDYIYNSLPEKWNEFIEEKKVEHNLIIKIKGKAICTHCKHEFQTKKKIGEETKCPNCKNTYLIKSSRLKRYWFFDNLILLDKVDDSIVYRYFEMWSAYDNKSKYYGFATSVVEYARTFHNTNVEVVNDRVSRCQCYIHVNHLDNPGKWREYTRNYSFGKRGFVYPDNLKEIFEDTEYKYLNMKEFVEKIGRINIEGLLKYTAIHVSFEMLSKMKLYNLALNAEDFYKNGSFQNIFGVPKDFYPFMKRNDITYKELKILRLLKQKDIKKIRYLSNYNVDNLEEISKYISLDKFIKYAKMHRGKVKDYLYKDYLRFAKELNMSLKDKKIIYPENLKEEHDKLYERIKIIEDETIKRNIQKRYKELVKNKYQDEKYIVFPAKSVQDLKDESKQQNHCVQSYAERYAKAICDIYFMRLLKNRKKSLVTIEVRNNKIIQKRIRDNDPPSMEENEFLEIWQEKVLQKCVV